MSAQNPTLTLPRTVDEAKAAAAGADRVVRAGATDLTELRARGLHQGDLVDLRDVTGMDGITPLADGRLELGAMVRIARISADPQITAGWAGVAAAAGALATPQIRARASLGGSLLQDARCWYFRSPEFACLKKGGSTCFARTGDAVFHSVVDLGPCIAPHPSTMAVALLAYGATAVVDGAERDMAALLGTGADPRRTHALAQGELLGAIRLPPAVPGERAAYFRAIHRARAEWPLVECVIRVRLDGDGKIDTFAIALGGIANRPIAYPDAATACLGLSPSDPKVDDVLHGLVGTASALPQAAYKALLVPPTLRETLDRALAAPAIPANPNP